MIDLTPVRSALLAEIDADAAQALAEATAEGRALADAARAEAATLLVRAREDGLAAGGEEAGRMRSQASVAGHNLVLAARAAVYDEFRRAVYTAVGELPRHPGYSQLQRTLEAAARARLGPGTQVELTIPPEGGVVARAGSRVVDHSLPRLADACIAGLGERVAELWQ